MAHFSTTDYNSRILVWQAATEVMNPTVDREDIEEAYQEDPQSAAAEYGAQFRDDLQSFLDADLLAKLTRGSPLELPPRTGIKYVGFIDPSGGRGDAMTMAIGHHEDELTVVDLVRSAPAPFDPATVVRDFAATLKEYGVKSVTGDAYSGAWVTEAFREHGIHYITSTLNKSAIYLEALPAFTRAEVELPDHRPLLTELALLERRTARGGKDSVDHPPRGHDDLANAVCGVIVNTKPQQEALRLRLSSVPKGPEMSPVEAMEAKDNRAEARATRRDDGSFSVSVDHIHPGPMVAPPDLPKSALPHSPTGGFLKRLREQLPR